MDLSRPFGNSVKDFIDKDSHSLNFCRFDDAIKPLTRAGKGAELAKQDIKHAFCWVPL